MATRKKSRAGEINFYKAMAVLGLIVAGALVYAFLGAAPPLSRQDFHKPDDSPEQCLACHVGNIENAPIIPHRPMEGCTFCHKPEETSS